MSSSAAAIARLQQLIPHDQSLTYVDCGARKGKLPPAFRPIAQASYVGIEADSEECLRLEARGKDRHRYIQGILGRATGARTFRITRSPACASLLEPNHKFLAQFPDIADGFQVERQVTVDVVTLDDCLAANDVPRADFIEMDVQGGELDVLIGAERTLENTVGLQIEVEFGEMYVGQPLFADIDSHVRARGFELFDLSRYRVRRTALHDSMPTRGQLLWGHALYLRDVGGLDTEKSVRLAMIALALGFPDLAAQVLTRLEADTSLSEQRRDVRKAREALADHVTGVDLPPNHDRAVWCD